MDGEIMKQVVVWTLLLMYGYLIVGMAFATVCYTYLAKRLRMSDLDRLDPHFRTRTFCWIMVAWLPVLLGW